MHKAMYAEPYMFLFLIQFRCAQGSNMILSLQRVWYSRSRFPVYLAKLE